MSKQINGSANPDIQVVDAAHKLASTHIKTPGLSPPNGATPESETELHSPLGSVIKPPAQSHLHPLSAVAENSPLNGTETPDPRYTSHSMAASVGSRGPETSGTPAFHGSKSVSDQAFPFPNGKLKHSCISTKLTFSPPYPLVQLSGSTGNEHSPHVWLLLRCHVAQSIWPQRQWTFR
jgi:hypothetical protein